MRRTGSHAATPTKCCYLRSSSGWRLMVIFAKEPERSGTPEDELLRQFQGMIAEYERITSPSAAGAGSSIALAPARCR